MKIFKDFKDFSKWTEKIVEKATEKSKEEIAKKVYEDSKKYTYIDTQAMYDSGETSDFKNGFVLIKAPQVRWLYYTTWIKGHKNQNARPQWFEATKSENMNNYLKVYINNFNKEKR